jgi:DNA helicase-2/ATP-dependent DNA helicase PcrA
VDEYQDVNKAQQKLISMAGEKSSVYVVGDPRQCIYQWRGSNKDYFDNFLEIFPDSESVMISENFRSASKIVENANKFSQTLEGNYENMKSFRSDSGEVLKVEFNDNEKEAENIVKEIKRLVEIEKKCSYSDISILFRSVKTSARPFIEVMKKLGIPYIVGGKIGLFKRDEAQVVGRLFAWLSEEGFWIKDIYNWKNSLKKDDLLESVKELLHNTFPTRDFPEKKLKEWKKEVLDGSYNDLTDAFHELLLILGYLKFDQEKKLDAAVMANLGRFNSLLIDFQSSVLIGGRRFNWKKDLKGLVWFMNAYASEAYEEQMPDDIRGIDAVQIMTIHQAKGLEWLVVFMPSLTNQRFPSRNIGREQNWFLSRDLFPVKRYEGDEDDERRLFYVAMTRARDNLIFSYFKFIKNPMKESPFLKDLKLNSVINNEKIEIANMEKHENEEEIQTFSGGEILGYNRCHYFYRLNCLWNYPSTFSPRLNFGKSLHHCLRRASELIKEESMEPKKAIEKVFEEGEFYLPYASKLQREVMTKYAKRSLLKYADKNKNDLLNVDEVEARIEFPLEKATIAGRVDVIIGPKGNLEVRDYKTSDTIITNEEASLQVQIYTLGLGLVNKNIKKASIAYIKEREGKVPIEKVGISKTDLEKAKKKAKDAIDGIKKGKWKARSSKHCDKCAYKKICRYTTCKRKTVLKFGGKNE